jgi:transcriptional regulator GlxA family with amidase domain
VKVVLALFPGCEILDLAGPLQAFYEANALGADYEILNCGTSDEIRSAQGLNLGSLLPLPAVGEGDLVIVPGYDVDATPISRDLVLWVRRAHEAGARVCSVCTGAFILGEASLLDGRRCTTHWKRLDQLQKRFPTARVLHDALYTRDGRVICSAGIASGIDVSLAIIEQDFGARIAAKVAREMVVYMRRDGHHPQLSIYFDFRSHADHAIHAVQDRILYDAASKSSLGELAKIARMSTRSLTRAFRNATGISIAEYRTRVRLQNAASLIEASELGIEEIAAQCGFRDASHLRKAWKAEYGQAPSKSRKTRVRGASA